MSDFKDDLFNDSAIAVIGLAGRFPGAGNIDEFWSNLIGAKECIEFFSDEQLTSSGVGTSALQNKNYVKARPLLENVEYFDADFFGFSPRDAESMDPQLRLFMECVWEALETAGYNVN